MIRRQHAKLSKGTIGKKRKLPRGFLLSEVVVAVLVLTMCLIPVLLLFSSTRTDTSRGVHRLRMMELANETIDWIMVCPYERLEQLAGFASGDITPVPVVEGSNDRMKPFVISSPSGMAYASEYGMSIKRLVTLRSVPDASGCLKEAEVRVSWKESNQEYSYAISTLVCDEGLREY